MAFSKLIFVCLVALLAASAHAQVVLDSSLYDPRVEQITVAKVYPINNAAQTQVLRTTTVIEEEQELDTLTLQPGVTVEATTNTIVNPTVTIQAPEPQTQTQTVVAERTVYVTQQRPVTRTVVNTIAVTQRIEPLAVTVTVTQTVAVRPRIRILPTTVIRTTLVTETLPYQEPLPLETVTATAYVTTTILTAETRNVVVGGGVQVTNTVWETRQAPWGMPPAGWTDPRNVAGWNNNNRGPETNTYSSTNTDNNSKMITTQTVTTYSPNAAPASAVGLRYGTGSFWTRSNLMQLCFLGAVLVASQAVLARMFA